MSATALRARPEAARKLAKGPDLRCFTVRSGGRTYGLPVERIQTVFEITSVTPVPLAPREIVGLVNLRGKIATAVSLKRRLQGGAAEDTSTLAVGLDYRDECFALIVDEVGDVITPEAGALIDAPSHLGPERVEVAAVYRLPDLILPVLALDWLFTFEEKR